MNASFLSGMDFENTVDDIEEDIIIHNISNSKNEDSDVEETIMHRVAQPPT